MSELLSVDSMSPLYKKIMMVLLICDGFTFQGSSYSCAIIAKHGAGHPGRAGWCSDAACLCLWKILWAMSWFLSPSQPSWEGRSPGTDRLRWALFGCVLSTPPVGPARRDGVTDSFQVSFQHVRKRQIWS